MRKFLFLALLCPFLTHSQPKINALSIGKTLPLELLQPYIGKVAPKIIVLDFFATWCGSCLAETPKLQALKKQFPTQLRVILVAYEPSAAINKLRGKNKRFASLDFPVIASDTTLSKYFPHRYLPHTVWLDESGTVRAITKAKELTAENITTFLNNKPLRLPLKSDLIDFNPKQPLLTQPGMEANRWFQSVFARQLEGAGSSFINIKDSVTNQQRITCYNYSPLTFLELTINQPFSNRWQIPNRFCLAGGDSVSPFSTYWCYERILPLSFSKAAATGWMLQDICRYFNINIARRKQTVNSWVLVHTGPDSLLRSKGGQPFSSLHQKDSALKCMRNRPISRFVQALNFSTPDHIAPIVIDETGITYNVDICFNIPDIQNISLLRKQLAAYGLRLLPVRREVEFLIIENAGN